jgi:transposase-like protein
MLYSEFNESFPAEEDAVAYFIKVRYSDGLVRPHCWATDWVYRERNHPKQVACRICDNSWSVFRGTIFEKSLNDIRKWFLAMYFMLNGRKGISGKQFEREIGVTYKTAWRMLKLIRQAMSNEEEKELFRSIVERDGVYLGEKPKRGGDMDKTRNCGKTALKTQIIGVKELSFGKVRSIATKRDEQNRVLIDK